MITAVVLLPFAGVAVMSVASTASAAGVVSPTIDRANGFPVYYQDSAGNRVEPCIDANDANCVLPTPGPGFDPAQPLSVPANFPDEFFYAYAQSDNIATQGCNGTAPGRALVVLALEGAFLNGPPATGDQMTFGRIRVRVTSGLCPNTTYQFKEPFGTETITTNAAGAVPPNAGTQDVGCTPAVNVPCDFTKANASRLMGSAANGFLRWDNSAPTAPAGYLGDGATLHPITGGTNGNAFSILDSSGNQLNDANGAALSTPNFTVSGKLAGSLNASPSTVDFGGQNIGTTSAAKTVTVTNWDSTTVTLGAPTITGGATSAYQISSNSCVGTLARDATCTIGVKFTPGAAGRITDSLVVPSTGGVRSPLTVALTGSGTQPGAAANIGLNPNSLAFGNVRIRTVSTPQDITVSNPVDSTAPLSVTSAKIAGGNGADQFQISSDTCTTGRTVDPGGSCIISVVMDPSVAAADTTTLTITSNAANPTSTVSITGTGTGGLAAVSDGINPDNGFPLWYMDENGVKVQQCLDPNNANCTVLPDEFFDPAKPLSFPDNFPSEFFFQDADSDKVITPGCDGGPTGSALFRSSIEGAFVNAGPVEGEQMTFGRIRIVVRGGLCPNSTYTFVHPYGTIDITTNATGGIAPNRGTEDVGCAPIAPDTCDFTFALSSRVFGGLLRWDPSVAPAAPAGYLGDAVTLHKVIGSPYSVNGNPVNSFTIKDSAGTTVASTNLFTVMGKLQGPLEASPAAPTFDVTPVGSTSAAQTVTYTNTGVAPITVSSLAISGTDAGDFQLAPGSSCINATLAVNATCTASVTFSPTATGARAAGLVARHTGLNDPFTVPLSGVGGASTGNAAISFVPRSLTFAPLHTGKTSRIQTIQVSNAGGASPLDVNSVTLGGTNQTDFTLVGEDCTSANGVPVGQACNVQVAFTPNTAGTKSANVTVVDNAPGGTHTVGIAGVASDANKAVSPNTYSSNGYPQYYQDSTGTRLQPCLDSTDVNCVLLPDAGYDPNLPLNFPSNFPTEFFYALADSNTISTPGCGGTDPGTALLRVALEGSFANGTPVVGDQTTFTRLRISVTSGLCPNTPYTFTTPFGVVPFTTNAVGGLARNAGTTDIGCAPAAPALCTFSDALGPRTPVAQGQIGTDTVVDNFLREDPATATPPTGYLGDGKTFTKVVGGTYVPAGASEPVNYAAIVDTAGNEVTRTNTFLVAGKVAGPLQSDTDSIDFGKVPAGSSSAARTVTVTNVQAGTSISSVSATGVNANQFAVSGGTCAGASPALDATCTVQVTFSPTSTGTKTATLRIVPATGDPVLIPLTGFGDAAQAPAITVTPGVLAYGTVTAPNSSALSTTIQNTGNAPLNLLGNTISGAAASDYSVTGTTCGASVAPGGSCTVTVRFKPTAVGSRAASLTIKHNAGAGSTVVSLTGTGAGSQFVMSPNPVTFGTVNRNTTKAQTISVRNSGTIAFTVGAVSFAGADAAAFSNGGGCTGTVLQPGKTCNLTVNFRPTVARAYTASVVLAGDATSIPATVSDSLSGTGK